MPVPLDEYPIHQSPLSIAHMDTSDRNAYDRCYLNAHDRTGDVFLVTGLGQYPNLGIIDAYATVRKGDRQYTIRPDPGTRVTLDPVSSTLTLPVVGSVGFPFGLNSTQ